MGDDWQVHRVAETPTWQRSLTEGVTSSFSKGLLLELQRERGDDDFFQGSSVAPPETPEQTRFPLIQTPRARVNNRSLERTVPLPPEVKLKLQSVASDLPESARSMPRGFVASDLAVGERTPSRPVAAQSSHHTSRRASASKSQHQPPPRPKVLLEI
jgi:hypothetical protein